MRLPRTGPASGGSARQAGVPAWLTTTADIIRSSGPAGAEPPRLPRSWSPRRLPRLRDRTWQYLTNPVSGIRRTGDETGVAADGSRYRHRWMVPGFWRKNQPYGPNNSLRGPAWVRGHVRGPEGAPFLDTVRVNVWRR